MWVGLVSQWSRAESRPGGDGSRTDLGLEAWVSAWRWWSLGFGCSGLIHGGGGGGGGGWEGFGLWLLVISVKAWAKEHMAGDALFAEASAFLWALQLAKNSGMQQIIVEGDAKLVVEALLKNANDVSWTIAAIISDALVLASSFSSCKFGWIKRGRQYCCAHIG
uniref:RNase H type-1 domain-containing protein n=1 Tax=Fagus sylvatica TaxID=28930 RepID=A0A2N9EEP0_FAGSY